MARQLMKPSRDDAARYPWRATTTVGALALLLLLSTAGAYGQDVAKEPIKGLDEQVQEIKSDMLSIAAELNQLEEKLLYPSDTQVAIFISLADGDSFRLDAVDIQLDGEPIARHLYSFKELEALKKGGVQRIYTGNVRSGDHVLTISAAGKSGTDADIERSAQATVTKATGPKIIEISLAGQGITVTDR